MVHSLQHGSLCYPPASGLPKIIPYILGSGLRAPEFFRGSADMAGDVGEGFVPIRPLGHRLPVGRCGQELPERGGMPALGRPQDDRDDAGLPLLAPLQR